MRRTFGRNLWLLGIPIETISELLGHSSSDMTRRYLGLNLTDMRQALARYSVSRECTLKDSLD
jgi:integrase